MTKKIINSQNQGTSLQIQDRLFNLALAFLFFYCVALTLAPAIRAQSFDGINQLRWNHWLGFFTWLIVFRGIMRQSRQSLPLADPYLIPIVALLSGWGLISIWRLTTIFGARQSLWIAICGALIIYLIDKNPKLLEVLQNYKYLWLIAGFVITALTFLFGTNPSGIGPDLWLGCCGIFFQPSEPLKLLLIIFLAAYIADRKFASTSIAQLLLPTLIMASLAFLLLLFQRDLGTAWVFLFIYTSVIFAATGDKRILIISALAVLLALYLGNQYVPLVHSRIEVWINPWADPSGKAYQIIQGLISIANGGLFGQGIGLGSPNFVPVAHTDYIFTAIVEENGFAGALALLTLIGLLGLRSMHIAFAAINNFHRYLAIGIAAYFGSQSLLIIGGALRLLPLTGLPLPFVSYGGSSLLTSLLAILILALISQQSNNAQRKKQSNFAEQWLTYSFIIALTIAALTSGWWAIIRGPDLLARPDNPRQTIQPEEIDEESSLFFDAHETALAHLQNPISG